ncbi:MAG: FAD-binding oxidoreductase [Micrococcales bacterium]|nr:FAD-binding oxidoreductase [Micrococcales bacterium]
MSHAPLRPLWWDDDEPYAARAPQAPTVPGAADVVIVGGGLTGLWSAYYLTEADPGLSVLVLEAEHVGFGASGRNGGWVSALWPVGPDTLAQRSGEAGARDMIAALRETVDEVGRAAAAEGVDAGFVKGGTVSAARGAAQEARARAEVAHAEHWGVGTTWLEPDAARERLAATDLRGATYNPNCARIHPKRLVDGLADRLRGRGVTLVEGARVATAQGGLVTLESGQQIRAGHVLRATEAFTAGFPALRRRLAPVYSLMVATEPLPQSVWAQIGLAGRETFSDHRHVIIYGQRTADDRIAFGGRGAPYHFGSAIDPAFDHDEAVFTELRRTLRELLPQIGDARFTHAWGGPLGIARDWHPSVGYDQDSRVGWAGGYVGDGVAATNLAGRTLADLVTGQRTALTRLPWVGHRSPQWEPEPARWIGVNAGLRLAHLADLEEARTGRPARLGKALTSLTGH